MLTITTCPSPLGTLRLVADDRALRLVEYHEEDRADRQLERLVRGLGVDPVVGGNAILEQAIGELTEYFAGDRTEFNTPVAPIGTTFQQRVWDELLRIPAGQTASYAAIARRLAQPTATRAVGAANGANPISILIPCHRVVNTGGALGGYGGGLRRKRWLLDHELRFSRESLFA